MIPERQAQEIADLIGSRLGVRGRGLEEKVRRAGRLLPKRIRRDAAILVDAERVASHPRLARQIDAEVLHKAHRDCKRFLEQIDGSEQVVRMVLGLLTANAFNVLALFTLIVAVLVWRGFL